MITDYEIRVIRPWSPGVKKGQILKVNARRKVQLVRGGFAESVEKTPAPVAVKPAKKKATGKAKDAD